MLMRYPKIHADFTTIRNRAWPGVVRTGAVCWLALTALLPLTLEQQRSESPLAQVLSAAQAQLAQPVVYVSSVRPFAALADSLRWPFGLTPSRAQVSISEPVVIGWVAHTQSSKPSIGVERVQRSADRVRELASSLGGALGFSRAQRERRVRSSDAPRAQSLCQRVRRSSGRA